MQRKVVLVTGASRGIGYETAKYFAKKNYDVVICYNTNYEGAKKLQEEIKEYEVKSLICKCDISNIASVKEVLDEVLNTFKKIDVLINNASISLDDDLENLSLEDFKKVIDVNLAGTFIMLQNVCKIMRHQGFGSVVNISSTNALDTYYPESVSYDASKAGIISLTHNFAKYYAPYIRVNAICPGWIDTDMNKNLDETFKQNEIDKIMLKRFGMTKEVAEAIYFVSNNTYINNEIIRVDGGSYGNR